MSSQGSLRARGGCWRQPLYRACIWYDSNCFQSSVRENLGSIKAFSLVNRSKNHAASSEACCRLSSRGCACISSQIIQSLGSAVASKSRNQRRSMVRTSLYLNFLRWGSIQRFWGYRQFSSELRASTHEATWPRQALSPLILSSAHQFAVLTTEG